MRAVVLSESADGRRLRVVDDHASSSVDGGVVIDVEVAGVTFPDVLMIEGRYQTTRELPFVPGAEAVGIVREAPTASGFVPGQRVVALTSGGGWQARVAAPPTSVFPVPNGLSAAQASSLLVSHVSAHFGLVTRGAAIAGETLLVHGAAGGLGSAAIELGGALGMSTVAVVSTPDKADFARALGADHVVLEDGWRDAVAQALAGRSVDILFDPVGGDRLLDGLRVLAPCGRYLVVGFAAGGIPEVKVNRLLLNNLSLVGVATGPYMDSHPGELARQWQAIVDLLLRRRAPAVAATLFDHTDVEAAVATVAERRAIGKIAITFTTSE